MKLVLIIALHLFLYSTISGQPFPYVDLHHNMDSLNNCVHTKNRIKSKINVDFIPLSELLFFTQCKQVIVDSILQTKNYVLDSTLVERDTPISTISYYTNGNSTIDIRKICSEHDSSTQYCLEPSNYIWEMPLSLFSRNEAAYLSYKKSLFQSPLGFKLTNCQLIHGGRNRIWYIEEQFEEKDFFIVIKVKYKKVKEKSNGFHCRQFVHFSLNIHYTKDYIKTHTQLKDF